MPWLLCPQTCETSPSSGKYTVYETAQWHHTFNIPFSPWRTQSLELVQMVLSPCSSPRCDVMIWFCCTCKGKPYYSAYGKRFILTQASILNGLDMKIHLYCIVEGGSWASLWLSLPSEDRPDTKQPLFFGNWLLAFLGRTCPNLNGYVTILTGHCQLTGCYHRHCTTRGG
jgi:hypothetical protein